MANSNQPPDSNDLRRGAQDGNQCTPVKDSIDLVECINFVKDRGRATANDPAGYDAGVFLTHWRLQDSIFRALQSFPVTPRLNGAFKVSHDMTVASFIGAQRALRKVGLSDGEGLNAAGFQDSVSLDRWSYWSTQPVPSWITPEK
jgi:hypothetical protein